MSALHPASDCESRDTLIENDLPSIACHAAIEIDNLILDRSIGFASVERLICLVSESISVGKEGAAVHWLNDPTVVAVVDLALCDAATAKSISTVEELIREAGDLLSRFRDLVQDPQSFKTSNLSKLLEMKAFCLALSRRASAAFPSPLDRMPEHPFRR